jgi:hypothetical protein
MFSGGDPEKEGELENKADVNTDILAVEHITGILNHFKAFPEVNYSAFKGHFRNFLYQPGSITVFQFSNQPPMIRKAVVTFLIQLLSQKLNRGSILLTHADDYLGQVNLNYRSQELQPKILINSLDYLTRKNLVILAAKGLKLVSRQLQWFNDIRNQVFLRMSMFEDRKSLVNLNQLKIDPQYLGLANNEGLLIREDSPTNFVYHFQLAKEKDIPVDLNELEVDQVKARGSITLGLSSKEYHTLMKLLKMLLTGPILKSDAKDLLRTMNQGEFTLKQLFSLRFFVEELDAGDLNYIITSDGRDFYNRQLNKINELPQACTEAELNSLSSELKNIEDFFDFSSNRRDREKINRKVKKLLGKLVNTAILLNPETPWNRIAELTNINIIVGLEWQDFRYLFNSADTLAKNLLVDIRRLRKKMLKEEFEYLLSGVGRNSSKSTSSDGFQSEYYPKLLDISQQLHLPPYPTVGVLDIHFELKKQGKSLLTELGFE